jgi:hypothetical protein
VQLFVLQNATQAEKEIPEALLPKVSEVQRPVVTVTEGERFTPTTLIEEAVWSQSALHAPI